MKILWLPSWYPEPLDPFNGDFIQRHALAASIDNEITVIHVAPYKSGEPSPIHRKMDGLTEIIHYHKSADSRNPLRKIQKWLDYKYKLTNLIENHIRENGIPELIHVHVPWKAGIIASSIARKYKIPLLITEHWNIYDRVVKDGYEQKSFLFRTQTKKLLERCDRLIVVSDHLGRSIQGQVTDRPYWVISNVVDTDLFHFTSRTHRQRFRFLHVSDLSEVKNPEGMLEAISLFFSEGHDADFEFIGNLDNKGPDLADRLGLDREKVRFRGIIPYPEVARSMRDSDAFFMFSRTESFSCVTAEALCSGLPVLASRSGALPELVNENNGILVPDNDVKAFSKALYRMMVENFPKDPEGSSRENCIKFSFPEIGMQFSRIYRSVVDDKLSS